MPLRSDNTTLKNYVEQLRLNSNLLWKVELAQSKKVNGYSSQASKSFLQKELNLTKGELASFENQKSIEAINQLLIEEQIILPNYLPSVLNMRRELLRWWKSLEESDKLSLSTFGNRIQIDNYISKWRTGKGYELLQQELDYIHDELKSTGVLRADYKPVKERHLERDSAFISKQSEIKWQRELLGKSQLEHIDDFLAPDSNKPYLQWEQLFSVKANTIKSNSGRANYRDAFNHVKLFLGKEGVAIDVKVENSIHEYFLINFKNLHLIPYMEDRKIAPGTAHTIMSCVRGVLARAQKIKGLNFTSFYDVELNVKGRVGDTYRPYSLLEREQIANAIEAELTDNKAFIEEYVKTDVGEYPLDKSFRIISGKSTESNARYLFENQLECSPVFNNTATTPVEKAFISIVSRLDKGLHQLYYDWGVLPFAHIKIIAPYVYQLCRITGINPESAVGLDIDSYVERHPLTEKPCIKYWKERGIGEQDAHLDLFDTDITWLPESQGKIIKEIFEKVIELTQDIRSEASPECQNKLFLYKSDGQRCFGKVMGINLQNLHRQYKSFAEKYNITDEKGKLTQFTLSRFRPTFVSEMVESGMTIREIQVLLGHSSIMTTMTYLDRLDFARLSRIKLFDRLQELQQSSLYGSQKRKGKKKKKKVTQQKIIFQTPLSGCTNVFDPPEFIRKSKVYREGQSCSQYNKCLGCENIMVTVNHLPTLFALQRFYINLTKTNRVIDTPYGLVIIENLSLLDQILLPDESDFTVEELEQAKQQSYHIELSEIEALGA